MDELTQTMADLDAHDLTQLLSTSERDAIKIICPVLTEMKKEVKTYVDTYYDITAKKVTPGRRTERLVKKSVFKAARAEDAETRPSSRWRR